MPAWVRRLGWRVCIASGVAQLRRSSRVTGGKGRQETTRGPKGMGENSGGVEQPKTEPETEAEKAVHSRERRSSKIRRRNNRQKKVEFVIAKRKKKLRTGSCERMHVDSPRKSAKG